MANYYFENLGVTLLGESDETGFTAENGDWTNRPASGDAILVTRVGKASCNKAISAGAYKLQWRRTNGDNTFYDVSASSEIAWGTSTTLVDGATCTNRTSTGICASLGSGLENEGDNSISHGGVASNIDVEFHWAINLDNAVAGGIYDFQIICTTDSSTLAGTSGSTIAIAVAAKDINAGDVSSQVAVADGALTPIRLIQPDIVSSQVSVSDASVTIAVPAKDINAGDVSSQVSVGDSVVNRIRPINAVGVSSQVAVDDGDLTPIRSVQPDIVSSQVTVDDGVVNRVRPIIPGSVSSQVSVSNASVQVVGQAKDINAGDVSSQVSVDSGVLSRIRPIVPDIVSSQVSVDSAILNAIRLLNPGDVQSLPAVDSSALTPIRAISPSDVESAVSIEDVTFNVVWMIAPGDVQSQVDVSNPSIGIVGAAVPRRSKLLLLGVGG